MSWFSNCTYKTKLLITGRGLKRIQQFTAYIMRICVAKRCGKLWTVKLFADGKAINEYKHHGNENCIRKIHLKGKVQEKSIKDHLKRAGEMSLNTTLPPRCFFTLTAKKTLVRATGDITLMYFYFDSFVAESAFLVCFIHPWCASLGSTARSMLRTQLNMWGCGSRGSPGVNVQHCSKEGLAGDHPLWSTWSSWQRHLFPSSGVLLSQRPVLRSRCDNGQYLLMHLIMSETWKNGCSFALEKTSPCFNFPCKSSFPSSQHSSPCNNTQHSSRRD